MDKNKREVLDRAPVIAARPTADQQAAGSVDLLKELGHELHGLQRLAYANAPGNVIRSNVKAALKVFARLAALDSRAQPVVQPKLEFELPDGDNRKLNIFWDETKGSTRYVCVKIEEDCAQPVAAGELPKGLTDAINEAADVLCGEREARGPLADELYGFALMLGQQCATTAPWLTLAHTICADAGIPPGRIDDRLAALRDMLDGRPAGGATDLPYTEDDIMELVDVASGLNEVPHWKAHVACKHIATFAKKLLESQPAATLAASVALNECTATNVDDQKSTDLVNKPGAAAVPDDVAKDAARYRWIRDRNRAPLNYREGDMDRTVDAAMLAAASPTTGEG